MAKDTLTVKISPALQEALGMHAPEGVDYYTLLGVSRLVAESGPIDLGVMERSKVLRKWQNSPQYGPEVVKLLTMLHRAGKILKDPLRREAYHEQLERNERGDAVSTGEEFAELARAAMADNQLDANSRRELSRFANERGLGQPEAQQILARVREELKAVRAAEATRKAADDGWEFRIAEQGEEGFALMLHGMASNNDDTDQTPGQLLVQAAKYGIAPERAALLLVNYQKDKFKRVASRVAHGGIISEAQARLLVAKAPSYGLDSRQAYELIADFTLSAHSTEDALRQMAMAASFSSDDISAIVANSESTVIRRRRQWVSLPQVPDWLRNLVLLGIAGAGLVALVTWLPSQFSRGSGGGGVIHINNAPPATTNPAPSPTTGPAPNTPPAPTPAAPAPTLGSSLVARDDPPSGLIAFRPEKPGDPPPFEMAIAEVTCAQYAEFLKANLESAPAGWKDGQPPATLATLPMTSLPRVKAIAYCTWLAKQNGWPPAAVRLPSQAEFQRALRGRTTRGNPLAPDYWVRARLGSGAGPVPVRSTQFDKIFIPGSAQMYDLLGNVAEWANDERASEYAILGGDCQQTDPGFNPLAARWVAASSTSPTIGFRYVHLLGQ